MKTMKAVAKNMGTVTHAGEVYKPNEQGIVSVPDAAVEAFKAHGFVEQTQEQQQQQKK